MTTTLEPPTATKAFTTAPPKEAVAVRAAGVLDVPGSGPGFLRRTDLLPTSHDVQVPVALMRRLGLRKGDLVEGTCGRPRVLAEAERVNGRPVHELRARPRFGDLTPLHPRQRLRLETATGGVTPRLVDLFTPIGKGQRGLIVAPPKTGKTVLLQQLAASVAANHPGAHLMVVLLDERPEEVTDMRRSVRGEVFASTFDQPARTHVALAELAVERAKRLVEDGRDVVILLDSLTRLCRAHNNSASSGGRTLSGGVDASALIGPKRFFGAARLAEEGGSLTILATALVDTGSRADDYYFEELKSTGNMEIRLDRGLAERRIHPAVDLARSGTRREELLLSEGELTVIRGLRRALLSRDGHAGVETLVERIRQTPDNATFLRQVQSTVPGA
ncbi:transcription termination factor Rho [Streptomyces antnestii]|uniref:Transcription termination factor Rho n=1 Tax=Streptomyces antnestii TaxID=2494256 RepID=A0A437PJ97_9ACTN|nr:transcription termination factor Rho [Streptomyces sp. San01]RVU22346.1 transcription termination factor Rho [Streptomyces sp. San01]